MRYHEQAGTGLLPANPQLTAFPDIPLGAEVTLDIPGPARPSKPRPLCSLTPVLARKLLNERIPHKAERLTTRHAARSRDPVAHWPFHNQQLKALGARDSTNRTDPLLARVVDRVLVPGEIVGSRERTESTWRKPTACLPMHHITLVVERMSGHPAASICAIEAADAGPEGKDRRGRPGIL